VNADDLGRSRGVNEGIARAHEEGIVTRSELDALCDSRVRAALDELGIELVSFDAIAVP